MDAIKGMIIGDPWADVPKPGEWWLGLDPAVRVEMAQRRASDVSEWLAVTAASDNGSVIVQLGGQMDAATRGRLLRELERRLKENLDPSIIVYLQPKGDKNKLRQLRGVTVKE